jgi:uncharacterized OsmC-like protein
MSNQDIAKALQRAEAIFKRRPEVATHDDMPATARWQDGTRVVTHHANGKQVVTDLPSELGGSGDQVTPGWLFRAGLAACAATCINMAAATQGIVLAALAVEARSRSDSRGLLGMSEPDGVPVYVGPFDMQLHVQISAPGISPDRLHALVELGIRNSAVPSAVSHATPITLHIHVEAAAGIDSETV